DLAIAGHYLVAVRDHALQRAQIDGFAAGFELEFGCDLADFGQAKEAQDLDITPTNIQLVPFGRELGRRAMGVMVIVQLFAADHDTPWEYVGAGIRAVVVAIAPVVANTVDHTSRPERDPGHLHCP